MPDPPLSPTPYRDVLETYTRTSLMPWRLTVDYRALTAKQRALDSGLFGREELEVVTL